jgi:hypothetical protein
MSSLSHAVLTAAVHHPALAAVAVVIIFIFILAVRPRADVAPACESGASLGWLVTLVVLAAAVLIPRAAPAAAPKPAPARPVVVQHTITRVIHSGMPGWGIVLTALAGLGICCFLAWRREQA